MDEGRWRVGNDCGSAMAGAQAWEAVKELGCMFPATIGNSTPMYPHTEAQGASLCITRSCCWIVSPSWLS